LARFNNIDIACPEQLHKEPIHGKIENFLANAADKVY